MALEERSYTVSEAALLLALTDSAVRKRLRDGTLRRVDERGHGQIRIAAAEVDEAASELADRSADAVALRIDMLEVERDRLEMNVRSLEVKLADALATSEIPSLRRRVDDLEQQLASKTRAFESLVLAQQSLLDTVRESTFEVRIND